MTDTLTLIAAVEAALRDMRQSHLEQPMRPPSRDHFHPMRRAYDRWQARDAEADLNAVTAMAALLDHLSIDVSDAIADRVHDLHGMAGHDLDAEGNWIIRTPEGVVAWECAA